MRFSTQVAATDRRRERLQQYFEDTVLTSDGQFICPHFRECCASHCGRFYEGQLHHVGHHYDLFENEVALRVVVVGQEYGHGPGSVSIDTRYCHIAVGSGLKTRFRAEGGYPARNPHMKGTTNVLRLVYGLPLGIDYPGEHLQVNGRSVHLFDAFALVNYLLCSAVPEAGGTRGLSTRVMRQNCQSHFRRALEILEPTVLIVQGKGFWPSVSRSFDSVEKVPNSTAEHFVACLNDKTIQVATFSHPSAPTSAFNWGVNDRTRYLLETVVPTIKNVRRALFGTKQGLPAVQSPSV